MSLAPRIPRSPVQHVRRERPGMSPRYLDLIRELPCLGCGHVPDLVKIEAHHLLRSGEHGTGRKSTDQWATPLCFSCHSPLVQDSVHFSGDEDAWFSARGIDARAVARALWAARDEGLPALRRIIDRARAGAALKARNG
jgi:hypothetical protein